MSLFCRSFCSSKTSNSIPGELWSSGNLRIANYRGNSRLTRACKLVWDCVANAITGFTLNWYLRLTRIFFWVKVILHLTPTGNSQTETSRTSSGTTGIDGLRPHMDTEMRGEFIQCSFEEHMKRYLHFVPDNADLNACIARMLQDRGDGKGPIITETLADEETPASLYFTDFDELAFTREKWTFSHLAQIAEIIGQSEINGRTLNFRFCSCPDESIKSDIERSTNQINACFSPIHCSLLQPLSRGSLPNLESHTDSFVPGIDIAHSWWPNIAVACEWKVKNTPEERLKVRFFFMQYPKH